MSKRVLVIFFFFMSLVSYGQNDVNVFNREVLKGYENKELNSRINLLDSIFKASYPESMDDVLFCTSDLCSISGICLDYDMISISSDDVSVFIIDKEKYEIYMKKLRLFAKKLIEINGLELDTTITPDYLKIEEEKK